MVRVRGGGGRHHVPARREQVQQAEDRARRQLREIVREALDAIEWT
jgi:hypothetical protein